jgi:hypothetical protein
MKKFHSLTILLAIVCLGCTDKTPPAPPNIDLMFTHVQVKNQTGSDWETIITQGNYQNVTSFMCDLHMGPFDFQLINFPDNDTTGYDASQSEFAVDSVFGTYSFNYMHYVGSTFTNASKSGDTSIALSAKATCSIGHWYTLILKSQTTAELVQDK